MARKNIKAEILGQEMEHHIVEIPPLLEEAFRYEKSAKILFEALQSIHQKEHINFITQAKQLETRKRRVIRVINLLYEGKKAI